MPLFLCFVHVMTDLGTPAVGACLMDGHLFRCSQLKSFVTQPVSPVDFCFSFFLFDFLKVMVVYAYTVVLLRFMLIFFFFLFSYYPHLIFTL